MAAVAADGRSRRAPYGSAGIVALIGGFALSGAAIAAGNKYSFARADAAAVDYRDTSIRAAIPCANLRSHAGETTRFRAAPVLPAAGVPEHCRIDGELPTEIGFQINLPTAWNGRLYMFGNGGYAGEDPESPRERSSRDLALRNGFATVRTDTGHVATKEPLATFARDPQRVLNHGFGAVHATIVYAKGLVAAYYGRHARFAYWDGCSTGGRQGVMSAQRFPADFDGIVAAAPTLDWSSIMIKGLWNRAALGRANLTVERMGEVFEAALARCDLQDGLRDGLIDDPRRCAFEPARDLPICATRNARAACFSPEDVEALQRLYAGPPKGAGIPGWVYQVPGFEHASTLQPFVMVADGSPDVLTIFAESWTRYIGFRTADYDPTAFDFDRDPPLIRRVDRLFNPTPDLDKFKARGGKMITFWGWADAALNPQMGLEYYDRVVSRLGLSSTQDFYRFFLIPGVAHCADGYGPDEIDAMTAVIEWVEKGIVPARLPARRTRDGKVSYDRAYCSYPESTDYLGSGDPEAPGSYSCVTPGLELDLRTWAAYRPRSEPTPIVSCVRTSSGCAGLSRLGTCAQ